MNKIVLYKNHNGTIGSWEIWTVGPAVISRAYKKLGGNPVEHSYIAEGKNIGRANETTPEQQAELEAQSKVRLKIDKGYVSELKDAAAPATNGLGLEKPMLATPIDKVKPESIDWSTAYVQPKLDGHRALYKDGVLYSRQGKELDIPHISEAIKASGLDHLHLDGELYLHGRSLQDLSRLIKKQTAESLALEYHIYDLVQDLPFTERGFILATAQRELMQQPIRSLRLVPTFQVTDMDEMMQWHTRYRAEGYEGTMLRFGNDPYGTDKRSRTLLKVKEFHDAEFTVIGCEDGKPLIRNGIEYEVPVWICDAGNGKTFNVMGAGDMFHRDYESGHRNEFIGKQLTVKYHYLSKDGIPQLPIALRWREDV